ncbi:phosphatidylserine decarboxylase family protein [Fluviicola taffensis]|uniref:Phosphatidylserine decarboxylase related protein n=1 Tax=Fluviicola taffensis (strain DSM 16823 / NCIMB 13979 / RW262) TaxID=755732 RepID=F2IFF7_FLUTR|nr:phosphatidylserine decarboxylase family protein [Fluviicola taffensis]AEA44642.1 phosphatidylserine decarboxylase related protein [Fluviicola taffensis DSM 16823]
MTLHREGTTTILIGILILGLIEWGNYWLYTKTDWLWLFLLLSAGALVMLYLIVQFFRIPKRTFTFTDLDILCPADGKVVVIEEVEETEYFKDRRIQVSIFMSPLNVHANYFPISGLVKYVKYHKGLFLVAWHPKSSTDNERSTVVVQHSSGQEVLFRQIAGAVARRICYYTKEGQTAETGQEFGFIKFGSRVDVFLPLGTKLDVKINQDVKAKLTKLGSF